MKSASLVALDRAEYAHLAHVELDLSPGSPQSKRYFGRRETRSCRLCLRAAPDVRFRTRSHLIPQALGNRGYLAAEECDECNTRRGSRLEDDLVKFLAPIRPFLPLRTAAGGAAHRVVSGGSLVETTKDADGRIAHGHTRITLAEGDQSITVTDTGPLSFDVQLAQQPFRPAGVVKALARMGILAVDASDVQTLSATRDWILNDSAACCVLAAGLLINGGIGMSALDVYRLTIQSEVLPSVAVFYNVGDLMMVGYCPTEQGGIPFAYPMPNLEIQGGQGDMPRLQWTFIVAQDMSAVRGTVTIGQYFERRQPASRLRE